MMSPCTGEEAWAEALHSVVRHGDVPDVVVDVVPNVSVLEMFTVTTAPFTTADTFTVGIVMLGWLAPQLTVAVVYPAPFQYFSDPDAVPAQVPACLAHGAADPMPLSDMTASLYPESWKRKLLEPAPHNGTPESTALGSAPRLIVPTDRCASACTQPSVPLAAIELHEVPDGEVSRSANTLLAAGADAAVANETVPSETPA